MFWKNPENTKINFESPFLFSFVIRSVFSHTLLSRGALKRPQMAQPSKEAYEFTSEPKAVGPRRKYRDPYVLEKSGKQNMMFDRRVVRGNTYAAQVLPASQAEKIALEREAREARRRNATLRRKKMQEEDERARTPEPVEGRKHMEIQTEQYLEEITDRIVESDVATQTDPFMDRPPTPLFVPQKSGIDVETQIYEGDLFDFDLEVDPILEVLVGKTLEQSMLEVMEEEELAAMEQHRVEMEQRRNEELAEVQRAEAQERRKIEEKKRRVEQERARVAAERETKDKLASHRFAKDFLSHLQGSVFNQLSEAGYFYDAVVRGVETQFVQWLNDRVKDKLSERQNVSRLVDTLLTSSIRLGLEKAQGVRDERQRVEEERLRKIEEERRKKEEEERRIAEEEERKKREEEERARKEREEEEEGKEDGEDGEDGEDEDGEDGEDGDEEEEEEGEEGEDDE
eukprot:TRINITY_DN414_c4_g1_i1.p1 TRINITY_DN414_c4_g1~~TRINITY_DN414_c4_g1_i1.p1  ORF type:complete len:456 (-),score=197.68 TRINITY_DN414_c4_g1_i1:27-1394(-)